MEPVLLQAKKTGGSDGQEVGAGLLGNVCVGDGAAGAQISDPCDHGGAPSHLVDDRLYGATLLAVREAEELPGPAHDEDGVRALFELEVDQPPHPLLVHRLVFVDRGGDRRHDPPDGVYAESGHVRSLRSGIIEGCAPRFAMKRLRQR